MLAARIGEILFACVAAARSFRTKNMHTYTHAVTAEHAMHTYTFTHLLRERVGEGGCGERGLMFAARIGDILFACVAAARSFRTLVSKSFRAVSIS